MSDILTVKRPDVVSLNLKGKSALYAAWIPVIRGGGLFMQTTKSHKLGDEMLIVMQFLDEPVKVPMVGRVVWINPPHTTANRPQGLGIQLPDSELGRELKKKIEGILAPVAKSERPTSTV